MSELTDLEIIERIAEIEGVDFTIHREMVFPNIKNFTMHDRYNPLTDDGLCFRLMIGHGINISKYYKLGDTVPFYGAENSELDVIEARTPNRAVCLAIISEQQ